MSKVKSNVIRKEKAIMVKKLITEGSKPNSAYNEAGRIINEKYGKGWQENNVSHKSYDDWWQECNMDGSFAYNGVTDDF